MNGFETLNAGIINFDEKLSLEEWVGDGLYVKLVRWIRDFSLLQGLVINTYNIRNSKKIAINFTEIPMVKERKNSYFEIINPTTSHIKNRSQFEVPDSHNK